MTLRDLVETLKKYEAKVEIEKQLDDGKPIKSPWKVSPITVNPEKYLRSTKTATIYDQDGNVTHRTTINYFSDNTYTVTNG